MGPSATIFVSDYISDEELIGLLTERLGDFHWDNPEMAYDQMKNYCISEGCGFVISGDETSQASNGLAWRLLRHHKRVMGSSK